MNAKRRTSYLKGYHQSAWLSSSRITRRKVAPSGSPGAPAAISSQVIERDRHADYLGTLGVLAATLEKIAVEMRQICWPFDFRTRLKGVLGGWLGALVAPRPIYVRQAILEHLEDLEDIYLAERALDRIRNDEEPTVPLEGVIKRYGRKVELSVEADRQLSKPDPQHTRRILKFLHERVAALDDARSIGEACTDSRLLCHCIRLNISRHELAPVILDFDPSESN